MVNAVYQLQEIPDVPEFEGFAFENDSSLSEQICIYDDFRYFVPGHRTWNQPRFAGIWKPRTVIGKVQPTNDYPTVGGVPAFSQRAVDALRDLLEPNGELLPLKVPSGLGPYYVYNTTTIADVIDTAKSKLRMSMPGLVHNIEHHEFIPERLKGLSIFRLPEMPECVYVTEAFASRVRASGLRGFHLMKLWPLPKGTDWYKTAHRELQKELGEQKKKARPVLKAGAQSAAVCVRAMPLAAGEEADSLQDAIAKYAKALRLDPTRMKSEELQEWLDNELHTLRGSSMSLEEKEDRAFWLGIAWGEAIIRSMKWQWSMLYDARKKKTLGIVSPKGDHAIPALQYIENIALGKTPDVTSHLLANLIQKGELPPAPRGKCRLIG